MESRLVVFLALLSGLLVSEPAPARSWRSDTQGRMAPAQVAAVNRAIAGCTCEGGYDRAPVVVEAFEPYYPAKLLARGEPGRCLLQFTVDTAGNVGSIEALEGNPLICAHSKIALGYWKFKPATLKGTDVPATLTVPFTYEVR